MGEHHVLCSFEEKLIIWPTVFRTITAPPTLLYNYQKILQTGRLQPR